MQVIEKYFPDLDSEQRQKLSKLAPVYQNWNVKVNLVSRKDIDYLNIRHLLHSMSIAKYFTFNPGTDILDIGTGGGFPGIPLAILFPSVNFHLVDSIGKKIKIVKNIAKELDLPNVTAYQERGEKIKDEFDFIASRSVTNLPRFFAWMREKIKKDSTHEFPNGIIYLKGGEFGKELKQIPWQQKVYHLNKTFEEPFFETKKLVYLYRPHK